MYLVFSSWFSVILVSLGSYRMTLSESNWETVSPAEGVAEGCYSTE